MITTYIWTVLALKPLVMWVIINLVPSEGSRMVLRQQILLEIRQLLAKKMLLSLC